ncbi:MAG: murein hydrolase activator EnvC family protein [Janthinobacterium lividum]
MPSSSLSLTAFATAGLAATAITVTPVTGGSLAAPSPLASSRSMAGTVAAVGRWRWPLQPQPRVLRPFDDVSRYAAGHRGVDLSAGVDQQVLAPADGTVTFAGQVAGRGVLVLMHGGQDGEGLRTSYEPVVPVVAQGTAVHTGDVVATVAAGPAHCSQPCLHLGLRRGRAYLDPLDWLEPATPPVLLPLGRPG